MLHKSKILHISFCKVATFAAPLSWSLAIFTHPAEMTWIGWPGKLGKKPMDLRQISNASNATAYRGADAKALGHQGAGGKWFTGQNWGGKTEIRLTAWNDRTSHYVSWKEIIAKELLTCKISVVMLYKLWLTGSRTTTVHEPSLNEKMMKMKWKKKW